jgi:hypothetical protein
MVLFSVFVTFSALCCVSVQYSLNFLETNFSVKSASIDEHSHEASALVQGTLVPDESDEPEWESELHSSEMLDEEEHNEQWSALIPLHARQRASRHLTVSSALVTVRVVRCALTCRTGKAGAIPRIKKARSQFQC